MLALRSGTRTATIPRSERNAASVVESERLALLLRDEPALDAGRWPAGRHDPDQCAEDGEGRNDPRTEAL
jgi:hypothetical protein